ncbi:MAG: hypothetical protein KKI09_01900 [Spirochaetes bacterium]|nr:hypothetical protein [Spirochaetota bacterium]
MRTTCDLNDSIMIRVQQKAVAEKRKIKDVLNATILAGLEHPISSNAEEWKCQVYEPGPARFDYTRAWELIDSLEIEAVADKLSLHK